MTTLEQYFIKRIAANGPITLAAFMADCLMHPKYGYYQRQRVFGKDGDFITAPEVSQMFGEMIGLWVYDRWVAMGKPKAVQLIEAGPGRGTLMRDILSATEKFHAFSSAVSVHFIETSQQLRQQQKKLVPNAQWHSALDTIPHSDFIMIGNEFFDALPIHQYEKNEDKWHEKMVSVIDGKLTPTLGPKGPQFSLIDPSLHNAANGSIAEVCPAALSVIAALNDRMADNLGICLFIDYGYLAPCIGDSFQALKGHNYVNPLQHIGEADLTAHVDFSKLAAASHANHWFNEQGAFLMQLGMGYRAEALAKPLDNAGKSDVLRALKRLTAPDEMGSLFKVMALQSGDITKPAGFE